MPTRPVELSDSDTDLDQFFVVARIDTNQEIEEEGMDLKQRSSLKGLMANRNKGQSYQRCP